jgi:RHS repeat-associated protein
MYVANTHLKPVIGIDIHFVNTPIPFIPLPHPYIGLVIDPFDYLPFIGATVRVNHVPRGNTDTAGMIITFVHIPFGIGFSLVPIIGHDSQNFFGSKTVSIDGAPMSGAGYMLMTCNDIGLPLSFKPGKKFKPIPSLYLPTSFCIPLQWGKPVMVGGPLVPNFSLMALLKAFAFGSFLKIIGKGGGKLMKKLSKKLKNSKASQKLKSALCKMGLEPVDLITGRVTYDATDFELPGAIPVKWVRTWDSDASFDGPLGHNVQLCYDRCVQLWPEEEVLSVTLKDGRLAAFPLLYPGESFYHPQEKLMLHRKQNGHFLLEDYNDDLYYHFNYEAEPGIWRLSVIENYHGNCIKLHYAGKYLCGITDSAGRQLVFELDKAHRITQVTVNHHDTQQVLISYGYNSAGDLATVADALNQVTTMEYHCHLIIKKTDRTGQRFYWEYDRQKRCVHSWGDDGVLEGFIQYGKGYNTVTNSLGENTTFFYDDNNLCIQVTDHYGNNKYTEYTEDFEVYREIDEIGNIVGYAYDEKNLLKEKTLPDGSLIQYRYNDYNKLSLVIYPDATTETLSYDDQRRLRFVNYPNGKTVSYDYNVEGHLEAIMEGNRKTRLTWDEDDNLVALQLPEGTTATWKFDDLGNCIQTTTTAGLTRYFEYDALNRVRKIHLPDGNCVVLNYNAYFEVTEAADKFNQVHFEYTPFGDLKKRRQGDEEMRFLYDTEGRLSTIIDEADRRYNFDYNHRGEIIHETGFEGLQRHYERDASGRMIKVKRPGERYTQYDYDANGAIIRLSHQDGSWAIFNYDKGGNLSEAINEHCTIRYKRDRSGKIVSEEQDGYKVAVSYDNLGNRTRVTSNLGADIQLQYDKQGYVDQLQAGFHTHGKQPGSGTLWQAGFTYNQFGGEKTRELPGDIKSEWVHGHDGRPLENKISKRGVVKSWKKYTWNTEDRLVNVFEALTQSNTRFKHDTAGNLVFAQYADNSIVHRTADATGNFYETEERNDRRYNAAGALLESEKYKYEYDDEGNLISKTEKATSGKTQYTWYANGMLKKVIRPDGKTVSFKYDALGRRIEKQVVDNSHNKRSAAGTITRWVWDGEVPLHEWSYNEKDRPQAVVNAWGEIAYDKEEPNPQNTADGITWVFEAENFIPCAKLTSDRSYSILCDHIGTPTEAYDEQGNKAWSVELDIYGRARNDQENKTGIPFRYQGQYEDEETGLYYNRFRYYSPEEGTYISQDPRRVLGGTRMYAYVIDPNALIDIFGLNPTYFPVDNLGRPTGATTDVTKQIIEAKTGTDASVDPPGWLGGEHPHHQQRGHLIAKNHGGSGSDKRNIVTITDGTNHPGMTHYENKITKHAKKGNTVTVRVTPHYNGDDLIPHKVTIHAVDQTGKVIVDNKDIPNGLRQNTKCCKP